jgi:3-oxoadipate enol-lactonase
MSIKYATTNGIELAYSQHGPQGSSTVIMLHCFCADHKYWRPHIPATAGFHTICIDVRGHGASTRTEGPYSLNLLCSDLVGLMDYLNIPQAHIVGVSMGGMISQMLTAHHPERVKSLCLLNTTPIYSEDQKQLWKTRSALVMKHGIKSIKQDLLKRWFTDEAIEKKIDGYSYMSSKLDDMHPKSFASITDAMCELNTLEYLPSFKIPTLVCASQNDPGVPIETSKLLAAKIKNSKLEWLDPAHHLASLEHVDAFNKFLKDHLTQ